METDCQMLQRMMADLMGLQSIPVPNDEAHHRYREKAKNVEDDDEGDLKGVDRPEPRTITKAQGFALPDSRSSTASFLRWMSSSAPWSSSLQMPIVQNTPGDSPTNKHI